MCKFQAITQAYQGKQGIIFLAHSTYSVSVSLKSVWISRNNRSKEKEQKDQVSLRGIHGATAGSGERRYRLRG